MNIVIGSIVARAVVLTCALLVAAAAPALANGTWVDIEADLLPCASSCVTVAGAEGDFEYTARFRNDGTVKDATIHVVVRIPVPNILGITARNSRAAAPVVIDLARLDPSSQLAEPYATCTMLLKRARAASLTYELTLSARLRRGQLRASRTSRGFCDVDLIATHVQAGMPAIQDGDFAFVSVNGTDILSSLLSSSDTEDTDNGACQGCWDY